MCVFVFYTFLRGARSMHITSMNTNSPAYGVCTKRIAPALRHQIGVRARLASTSHGSYDHVPENDDYS